jgi:PRTRC genetic system ThiF family protein
MTTLHAPDFISNFAVNTHRPLNVVVIGAGGTGSALMGKLFQLSHTLTALCGKGIHVTLWDDDTVSQSNLGRQAYFPFDLGNSKAQCLIERFNQFSDLDWSFEIKRFGTQEDETSFRDTVIFGCVDNVKARKAIDSAFKNSTNCIYIDAGNDSNSSNVIMAVNATTQNEPVYVPSAYDLYQSQFDNHIDNHVDSCSAEDAIRKQEFGVNDIAAAHCVQMLWQLIRHGEIDYHGVNVNLKTGETHPLQPLAENWSMYGYVASTSLH